MPTFVLGSSARVTKWRSSSTEEFSISTASWRELIRLTSANHWVLRPPYTNPNKYRGVFTCKVSRGEANFIATIHVRNGMCGPVYIPFRLARRLGMYNYHHYYLRSVNKKKY